MSDLITVEVVADTPDDGALCPDTYDYNRLPEELRDAAMLAQGTVLTKLGGAVERVIDAGNTLRWAKATLPHGEYLPWVRQACGLKRDAAAKLVKAAEWVEMSGTARHLDQITDTDTLFLLSADATPADVREWVMERCAAGDPPTRKEVQERKRASQGRADRTIEQEALSALKLSAEARALAAAAQHVSTRQLMDALGLEELPKGRHHETANASYYRNGDSGWWKLPRPQQVDLPPASAAPEPAASLLADAAELVTVAKAAELLGFPSAKSLTDRLVPSTIKRRGMPRRNDYEARPSNKRGMCFIERITAGL